MFTLENSSKYYLETISLFFPFDDVFVDGESITGTPTISVILDAGEDTNPSNILYEGVSIANGNKVEQRVRLGIPGDVYILTCSIVTTLGNIYEKEIYLAIIPTDGTAIPVVNKIYLSSTRYPYEYTESLLGNAAHITGGILYKQVWNSQESLSAGAHIITGGNLTLVVITYSNASESLTTAISIIGGTFNEIGINYSYTYEELRGNIAIIGGSFNVGGIYYLYSPESLTGTISITGGSLA